MRRRLLFFTLTLSACPLDLLPHGGTGGGSGGFGGFGGSGAGGSGTGGGNAQVTAPPVIPVELFGLVSDGSRLVADVGNARLELDPTHQDALTALGACADLISYCYAPGSLSLSECFGRAAKCTTSTPWAESPCCPADCQTAFDAEVASGTAPVQALDKVLFRQPDCFPGVRALLEAP